MPTLVAYGIGEMAITTGMVVFGLFVLFFYTSVMGVPGLAVGVASAAGLVWDALLDPYIGHRSDLARGRFARRHAFMLVGSLTMGLSFWMLLAPPRAGVVAVVCWLVVATFLFRTTSALFRIPYLGLGAELSTDYHGRTVVVGVRAFFGLCGTLIAAALSFPLFFPNTVEGVDPKLSYAGYPALGLAAGAFMTVSGLIATAGTWGWCRQFGPAGAAVGRSYAGDLRTAFSSHAFRRVWASLTLFFLAVVVNAVVAIHFFTWYVRIEDSTVLSRIQLAFYAGALVGVPCWIRAARRREKRVVALAAIVATGLLLAMATLLFGEGRPLGTGSATWLAIGHVMAGLAASAVWVLPGSMVADVADEDALSARGAARGAVFRNAEPRRKDGRRPGAPDRRRAAARTSCGSRPAPLRTRSARRGSASRTEYCPALILCAAAVPLLTYTLTRHRVEAIQRELHRHRDAAEADRSRFAAPRLRGYVEGESRRHSRSVARR